MSHLEGAYEQVNQRLAGFDLRFDAIDRRFDAVDRRFDAVDRKLESLRSNIVDRLDQRFMWTVGLMLTCWFTTILGLIGVLIKH
jgi:tetrahydromethanopterin S-methyltransferase subunit G